MTVIETKVKRWGNSLAFIIPSHAVESRKIRENDELKVIIVDNSKKNLEEAFGSLKGWKINSQKTKNELRKEWLD